MKLRKIGLSLVAVAMLAGCQRQEYEVTPIEMESYAKVEYNTRKVLRGDLTPSFELSLSQDAMKTTNYGVSSMKLIPDKVYVKKGDKVKTGQIMVSFLSESLDREIAQRETNIKEIQLQIDNMQRKMEINPKLDFKKSIVDLQHSIEVHQMYIDEYKEKLKNYQIVSETDGTVVRLNSDLENGYLTTDRSLVTVSSGNGLYRGLTKEKYDFKEGDIFTAYTDGVGYDMKLISIGTEDRIGNNQLTTLVFEPVDDISGLSDAASMTVQIWKETQKDVLYLDKKLVRGYGDKSYVKIVNSEGYVEERVVEVGDTVDDYIIIKSGLTGDEEVLNR